jgi:L-asparagine transporter-like permease
VLNVVATLPIYLACCAAPLELRRRDVGAEGAIPFRLPGGLVIPVLACVVVLWLLSFTTATEVLAMCAVLATASLLYLLRYVRRQRDIRVLDS